MKPGAMLVAILQPYQQRDQLPAYANAKVNAFAMELVPRITRAQSMDVLSSQANLAGYRAVLDAASEFGRAFPMMMTAAGTVPPARVTDHGRRRRRPPGHRDGQGGWAASCPRPTCVRPPRSRSSRSARTFVAVEDDEFKEAETAGGYAKEMSKAYQAKQRGPDRRDDQEAGHHRHHGADSRPQGPDPGDRRDGRAP